MDDRIKSILDSIPLGSQRDFGARYAFESLSRTLLIYNPEITTEVLARALNTCVKDYLINRQGFVNITY